MVVFQDSLEYRIEIPFGRDDDITVTVLNDKDI